MGRGTDEKTNTETLRYREEEISYTTFLSPCVNRLFLSTRIIRIIRKGCVAAANSIKSI